MSTIYQLNPTIPVLTPKGEGQAHLVIDDGMEHNLHWTVFIDATGECWTFDNLDVRLDGNLTEGRPRPKPQWRPVWSNKQTAKELK